MTTFESIILLIIYAFCYGYALAIFIKEKNVWVRIFFIFLSLWMAFYAPILMGGMLYNKLSKD